MISRKTAEKAEPAVLISDSSETSQQPLLVEGTAGGEATSPEATESAANHCANKTLVNPIAASRGTNVGPEESLSGVANDAAKDADNRDPQQEFQKTNYHSGVAPAELNGSLTGARTQSHSKSNNGLLRHRLIVASCVAVSSGLLALSGFDLASSISRPASIDRNFKITYNDRVKRPELPANLMYPVKYCEPTEGMFNVIEPGWDGKVVGFVDCKSGKVVVKPQFEQVYNFYDGLAAFRPKKGNKYGFIDKTGAVVVKPIFEDFEKYRHGVAAVKTSEYGALIDKTGRIIFRSGNAQPHWIGIGYVAEQSGKQGVVNEKGEWIIKPEFERVAEFTETRHYKPFGYYIEDEEPDAKQVDTYFKVRQNDRYGVIDANGKQCIPAKFSQIFSYKDGHAVASIDNRCALVDKDGKEVLGQRFDYITAYDDLIAVADSNEWHFIDKNGNSVKTEIPATYKIPFNYHTGQWLSDGLGLIIDTNGKYGYANSKGQIVIKPQFKFASQFSDGYANTWTGSGWKFIKTNGQYACPMEFARTTNFDKNKSEVTVPGPLYWVAEAQDIHRMNDYLEQQTKAQTKMSERSKQTIGSPIIEYIVEKEW
jgi:hypothetical protein